MEVINVVDGCTNKKNLPVGLMTIQAKLEIFLNTSSGIAVIQKQSSCIVS